MEKCLKLPYFKDFLVFNGFSHFQIALGKMTLNWCQLKYFFTIQKEFEITYIGTQEKIVNQLRIS